MTDRTALRLALLDMGRQMLYERPATPTLDHIKIAEVARRAGVTTGAIYHYWESQDEYRADLLDYVLSPDRYAVPERIAQLLESQLTEAGTGQPALPDLVREIANVDFDEIKQSPDFRVQLALWLSDEPQALDKLRSQYRGVDARLIELYQAIMDQYQLEPRPPFTLQLIATIATAILEGLVLRHHADPDSVPDALTAWPAPDASGSPETTEQPRQDWNLFGLTLAALLPALTRARTERSTH